MATTWDEASKCPRDGQFTGKVIQRRNLREGGQLITLECPEDNCEYSTTGWVVQTRPDGSIPDPIDPNTRDKNYAPTSMSHQRRRMVLDALEEQAAAEQRPGTEVRSF
jgi:hypothetical protein